MSAASPTIFPELNELLEEFVARVQSILAGNFVGAYLTGSLALGAGDIHSDCDFSWSPKTGSRQNKNEHFASSTTRSRRAPVTSLEIAWSQRYAVTTLCRMLYTLESGEVTSKPASLEWARDTLSPVWHDLIQQVLDDRSVAWDDPPRTGSVEPTIAFAEYAKRRAANSSP